MKRALTLSLLATLILTLVACGTAPAAAPASASAYQSAAASGGETVAAAATESTAAAALDPISVEYDSDDLGAGDGDDQGAGDADAATITLAGDSISLAGSGATVTGTVVTVTAAGTYRVSGRLDDGQVVVDTADEGTVRLVLDGVDITCSTSAPIYVVNADKVVITLAEGSQNAVGDGTSYVLEPDSDEPDAAIFSHGDLTINGGGSLTVNASHKDGIASNDDLKITGGRITVNAVNDGIKGKDSLAIKDGVITVNAGADGLQATNDVDAEEGFILIEGGALTIAAGLDGIQAQTRLAISGGSIAVVSGGGSANGISRAGQGGWGRQSDAAAVDTADSTKGLKAGLEVAITGGSIEVDAADDAVHSNASVTIGGGVLTLSSGDDGVHADATLTVDGGELSLTRSYEGLESAAITINDGTIHLVASDDGINASSGGGDFALGGRPGQGGFMAGASSLAIHGGTIVVDAGGDGLDANGSIEMTGGLVLVDGPTNNGNGALDCIGTFTLTGGFLVAAGSAGMAEAPDATSTQPSVLVVFSSALPAGTLVHVASEDGQEILTFAPSKSFQSLALSSPELEVGATYVVTTGGRSTGTATDGLYTGGTYSGGTQTTSFTITGMVTGAGSYSGGFPAGPGYGRQRP